MAESEFIVKFFDKAFESEEYENLAKKPVSAISGISEEDTVLLKKAFGIDNIKELAKNKYVATAQTTRARIGFIGEAPWDGRDYLDLAATCLYTQQVSFFCA